MINPFGKVLKSIPIDKEDFLTADIYKIDKKTFYSIYGDILTRIFVVLMALSFLVYGVKKAVAHE